jgi:hypothetical protein
MLSASSTCAPTALTATLRQVVQGDSAQTNQARVRIVSREQRRDKQGKLSEAS